MPPKRTLPFKADEPPATRKRSRRVVAKRNPDPIGSIVGKRTFCTSCKKLLTKEESDSVWPECNSCVLEIERVLLETYRSEEFEKEGTPSEGIVQVKGTP
ncbi:hypothetical protein AAP_04626 [Ascosphaera apis ARSEF 7405]|uniref:Uncharacterized protein n=1 Tax=Ascosphaera apis ARSEF 7405 TaxID=392613 RepID=A0A167WGY3_9EURO|nr:hypothetical protein AAP_04626 [Ascosphaera apis ARSEF 7405]